MRPTPRKRDDFIHLHVHTDFSLLDGCCPPERYCARAREMGFKALAVTDHGNVDAALRFQKAAEKEGITPLIGCEGYLVPDATVKTKEDRRSHVVLLARNAEGWRNLLRMLSRANLEGFYHRPRIDHSSLLANCQGLVVLTGCVATFLRGTGGEELLDSLAERIPGDVYLEVMPHDTDKQKEVNELCLALAGKKGIPLVATNDCHYSVEAEWEAQKALLGIQYGLQWNDARLEGYVLRGIHLRSAAEMGAAFEKQGVLKYTEYVTAMRNTLQVAERCGTFRVTKQEVRLPVVPGYEGRDDFDVVREQCLEALSKLKIPRPFRREDYESRLERELYVIGKKKVSRYFLMVADLVRWCRGRGIVVGPRGSAAGSLLVYLMDIVRVDPMVHGLSFDRFLNEDRIDLPDIDLDFDDTRRGEIRMRLEELYGEGHVAGIGTFGKLENRAVVRDVGKVFEVPNSEIEVFTETLDKADDLATVYRESDEGKEFARKQPKVAELTLKLHGVIRNRGQHAAAVVVSPEDLRDGRRAYLLEREGVLTVNWAMEDAEKVGLLKLDVLGLKFMAVVAEVQRLVKQNHGKEIVLEEIPLEDPAVLKDINDGNTVGLFQVSTRPMNILIKEMGISTFRHISDAIALVRPGPTQSGMTKRYIERKHSGKWDHLHPLYEAATKDTYGVVTYQEQIMRIAVDVAGMKWSEADTLRKVIGKKRDVKEFAPYKAAWIDGCRNKKTLTEAQAERFWEELQKYASYSFNLSHSVCYAIVAVWTGWFKHYYPTEYACAFLTRGSDSKESKARMVKEARRMGLRIIPPKVGISKAEEWVAKDGKLYVPFITVKGIGPKTAAEITGTAEPKKKQVGFFGASSRPKLDSRTAKILAEIGAYDRESVPSRAVEYLEGIDLGGMLVLKYPRLAAIVGEKAVEEDAVRGKVTVKKQARRVRLDEQEWLKSIAGMAECRGCGLRSQASKVVLPSWGEYNVAVLGEGPGSDEDEAGEGFVGRAGKLLWDELAKTKIKRKMVYVTNAVHCYPSKDKNPKKECTDACAGRWLVKEFGALRPCVVLVMGNVARYVLTGEESGIMFRSGETEWLERWGFWACWCVHPAAVLRAGNGSKGEETRKLWEKGIRNFSDAVEKIGGI